MVKIKIIATGNEKDKFINGAISELTKRISRWAEVKIIYVNEYAPINDSMIETSLTRESEAQLKNFEGFVFALDKAGKTYSSEEFAEKLDRLTLTNSTITFIIGGSCGLSNTVKDKANALLSFGPLTLPHELARLVLVEQIYRAFTIKNNLPYHK